MVETNKVFKKDLRLISIRASKYVCKRRMEVSLKVHHSSMTVVGELCKSSPTTYENLVVALCKIFMIAFESFMAHHSFARGLWKLFESRTKVV